MKALFKAIKVMDELIQTSELWHLPPGLKINAQQAKLELIDEVKQELKSLRQQAEFTFKMAHDRHISGGKETQVKRIMKSAQEFEQQALELEQWLMKN